jgi:hypothetical protein
MDERQEALKEYILLCLQDSKLQWADLVSPNVIDKVMKTMSRDIVVVLRELGRRGGIELMKMAIGALSARAGNGGK